MKKQVVIIGAAGRMGKALVNGIATGVVPELELVGAVDLSSIPDQGKDIGELAGAGHIGVNLTSNLPALVSPGRIFIDFSFHSGIAERGEVLSQQTTCWVIGTTGLSPDEQADVSRIAGKIPVVFSPNMSLGVNLLAALVEKTAAALANNGYDIEILERHHRKKVDAPSGTALYLGESAARGAGWKLDDVAQHGREGIREGDRPVQEIGFHSFRGGDLAGDHTVTFAADGELIELSHRATSRDTFAIGALRAAGWLAGKPAGLYTMNDVLGLS